MDIYTVNLDLWIITQLIQIYGSYAINTDLWTLTQLIQVCGHL